MPITFNYTDSALKAGLDKVSNKLGAVVLMYAATEAIRLEAYMKSARPWTDRTGAAKATLSARVSQPDTNTIRITLAHGVNYGKWLELAHEGKYAIISPTIKLKGQELVDGLKNIFEKLK